MAGNVLSTDSANDKIHLHSGFTSTISNSFSSPSNFPLGLSWDGTNVLSSDIVAKIYQHTGFSSTIANSFSSPDTQPFAVSWDGANVLSADQVSDFIYKHAGFSSTISDSFSSPSGSPSGLAWDGTNLMDADGGSDAIYAHAGFSTTISSSFSSPSTSPSGLTWDSSTILSGDGASNKIYQHTGFSSTISDSFSSVSNTSRGITDDSWSGIAKSAALTGTITAGVSEADIVAGGKTLIITLTNDTWIAAGALDFDLQRDEIIAGVDSAQSEATGWDLVPKATQSLRGVVRTSNTVVTITWDAFATYNITAQETITVTVPATAVVGAGAIVATPTFTVSTVAGGAVKDLIMMGIIPFAR